MAIPLRIRGQRNANPVLLPNVSRKVKRDFRLWLGIGLLMISILSISHLISAAGARTLAVALVHDVPAGTVLSLEDIEVVRVALPNADKYFDSIEMALGTTATRDMSAGELIPATVQSNAPLNSSRSVSLPIRAGHLPAVQAGDLVDIWSTPSSDSLQLPGPPKLLSRGASVISVPDGVDPTSDTALTVLLPRGEVAKIIQALRDGQVDVVAIPQGSRS